MTYQVIKSVRKQYGTYWNWEKEVMLTTKKQEEAENYYKQNKLIIPGVESWSLDQVSDLEIELKCDNARYSEILGETIDGLKGKEILYLSFESDYQGYVDIDVLLEDGRIFSYSYNYGSCSGCDEWESENYNDDQIKEIILKEATFFQNIEQYKKANIRQ